MSEPETAGAAGPLPKPTTLYLVAHKAHGLPAFDVAERLACPECKVIEHWGGKTTESSLGCDECDHEGFWWIGATSGWRMYPWWWQELEYLYCNEQNETPLDFIAAMPPSARNLHNPLARDREPAKPSGLLAALGLVRKAEPIKRRI